MSERSRGPEPAASALPDAPSLEWLRKQAKHRLRELRESSPDAQLADAQLDLARRYGFPSWRALKAHVDSLTVEGRLFEAARTGDLSTVVSLLATRPSLLHARAKPYEWSLLHTAAFAGHLPIVDVLLRRGLDANVREKGDDTTPLHWAAAAGHVEVARRLVEAGGDVVGRGDDHELEVIGWATCWDGCDDDAHRAIVDLLVAHGARHHIFSAIAMRLEDEVRRIVAEDPAALDRRMSRNEDHRTPLHFAVQRNRPEMVAILTTALRARTTDEWLPLLREADILCSRVATYEDVLRHPQVAANAMLAEVEHPVHGRVRMPGFPVDSAQANALPHRPAPGDGGSHVPPRRDGGRRPRRAIR